MARRVMDLYAAFFGDTPSCGSATQIVGPESLSLDSDDGVIEANNDGLVGPATHDKAGWSGTANLGCQDVSTFAAVLSAFEGATDGIRAMKFEGRERGSSSSANATLGLLKRMMLSRASLSVSNDNYASVNYGLQAAPDSASDSEDDEWLFTEGNARTATVGSAKRAYRVYTGVTHGGNAISMVRNFSIDVAGQVLMEPPTDGEWGKVCDIASYSVSGALTMLDQDVATAKLAAQTLRAAAVGALVVPMRLQGGSTSSTLTIANVRFTRSSTPIQARGSWATTLNWVADFLSATTVYKLATGSNKVIGQA